MIFHQPQNCWLNKIPLQHTWYFLTRSVTALARLFVCLRFEANLHWHGDFLKLRACLPKWSQKEDGFHLWIMKKMWVYLKFWGCRPKWSISLTSSATLVFEPNQPGTHDDVIAFSMYAKGGKSYHVHHFAWFPILLTAISFNNKSYVSWDIYKISLTTSPKNINNMVEQQHIRVANDPTHNISKPYELLF